MIINPFHLPDGRIATFLRLGTVDMNKSEALANATITTMESGTDTLVLVSDFRGMTLEAHHAKLARAIILACGACRNDPEWPNPSIMTGYIQSVDRSRGEIEIIVDCTISINPTDELQKIITTMVNITDKRMEDGAKKMTIAYDSFKDTINNAAYRIGLEDKYPHVTDSSSKSVIRFVPYLNANDKICWVPTEMRSRTITSRRADLPSIDIVL